MTDTITEITTDVLHVPEISTKSGNLVINAAQNIVFQSGKTIDFAGTVIENFTADEITIDDINIIDETNADLIINCDTDNAGGQQSRIIFRDGPTAGPTETGRIVADDDTNTLTVQAGTGSNLVMQANGANTVLTLNATGDNNISASGNIALNDNILRLRNDENHGLRFGRSGTSGTDFAGLAKDGAVLHGNTGGFLGVKSAGDEYVTHQWSTNESAFYGKENLELVVNCDTAAAGNKTAAVVFKDGTYVGATTQATIATSNAANSLTIRAEAGNNLIMQTNGANTVLTLDATGDNNVLASGNVSLNRNELRLLADEFHVLRFVEQGGGTKFAGLSKNGPVLHGYAGGFLGIKNSTDEYVTHQWSVNQSVFYGAGSFQLVLQGDTDNAGGQTSALEFKTGTYAAPTTQATIVASDATNSLTIRAEAGNNLIMQTNGANTVLTLDATGNNNIVANGNISLEDNELRMRNDENHVLRYVTNGFVGTPFAGLNMDGPVLHGYAGGFLGIKNSTDEYVTHQWSVNQSVFYGAGSFQLVLQGDTDNAGGQTSALEFKTGTYAAPTTQATIVASDATNSLTIRAEAGNNLIMQTNGANTVLTLDATGNNNIVANGNISLEDNELRMRNDENHVLRYVTNGSVGTPFAGLNMDGPVLHGHDGGFLGVKNVGGEFVSHAWEINESRFYAQDNLSLIVQCDTAAAGNRTSSIVFRDGTYAAPTTQATIVTSDNANSLTIRAEAGNSLALQTNGANDRLTIAADGTGTWDAATSLTLQSSADANSGSILLDNTGVLATGGATGTFRIFNDGTGTWISPTSLSLISSVGRLTLEADGVIFNDHLEVPLFASGTISGGSSFGTAYTGSTAIIWARIDGNWASADPNAISAQSGGISTYTKNNTGDYTITFDAEIFSLGRFTATANAENTNIIASVRQLTATTLGVTLYDAVRAAAIDDIFNLIVIGKVNMNTV